MTFYATADKEFGIGEYRTVTEARKESVKFMKKYPNGYSMVFVYNGRKLHGIVDRHWGNSFEYSMVKGNGTVDHYELNNDGTLGHKKAITRRS